MNEDIIYALHRITNLLLSRSVTEPKTPKLLLDKEPDMSALFLMETITPPEKIIIRKTIIYAAIRLNLIK